MSPAARVCLAQYKRYRQLVMSSLAQPAAAAAAAGNIYAAADDSRTCCPDADEVAVVTEPTSGLHAAPRHNFSEEKKKKEKERTLCVLFTKWGKKIMRRCKSRHKDKSGDLSTRLGR